MGGHVVAVYGTLKRGQLNHRLLERGRATFVGEGTVAGALHDLGWYPGLVPDDSGPRAEVELYDVDDELLRLLDRLEAYDPEDEDGSEYVRRLVDVTRPDTTGLRAWVYLYAGPMDRARRVVGSSWPER